MTNECGISLGISVGGEKGEEGLHEQATTMTLRSSVHKVGQVYSHRMWSLSISFPGSSARSRMGGGMGLGC